LFLPPTYPLATIQIAATSTLHGSFMVADIIVFLPPINYNLHSEIYSFRYRVKSGRDSDSVVFIEKNQQINGGDRNNKQYYL